MAVDTGHLAFGQRCMDHLADLTGGLNAGRRMTAFARHVALASHGVVHVLGKLAAPSFPGFVIIEISSPFRD